MQDEDVMEMKSGPVAANGDDAKYGVESGYSEDYGATPLQSAVPTEDQGYGSLTSNKGAAAAAGGEPAKNPFTQQEYDSQKSSNPFK